MSLAVLQEQWCGPQAGLPLSEEDFALAETDLSLVTSERVKVKQAHSLKDPTTSPIPLVRIGKDRPVTLVRR